MLSRRKFLASLGVVPVLTGAVVRAEYEDRTPQMIEDIGEVYRSYKMFWTGWKPSQGNVALVGQWVGYPVYPAPFQRVYRKDSKFPFLYSSVPGGSGAFARGAMFSICVMEHQRYISWNHTSEAEKDQEIFKGKRQLMKLIDCTMDNSLRLLSLHEWDQLYIKNGIIPGNIWEA